ncbi:acyl-CoA dehydrogenase family protein [Brachybacterium saurashtrense]|uniref:Acyl-CoA dehydrogenase n=1 Tax=Brachybacterium saurashtrense TaxID=556288 RepID=A0A345YL51_9MICO|nr:acyl-CoA dehydrogenase family protein [Brachybacterium saurashtrense]AXK44653.1 acyl-CoA dehydrogenase [Brachybacterium saurashtrense]RRR23265.1 acyl-CoA dehydrogenase [Brachybacterium saurashtrense]
MSLSADDLLPDSLLETFRERAAVHDRENTFPEDDLADLRDRGYLRLLVPSELGGTGASLLQASRIQRRLAGAAPATALALNMHLVVTGAALHAHRLGVEAVRPILEDAAADRLFAFGISEAGNDAMLFDSSTRADAQDGGGFRLTGTKIFTSAAPVWDRLVAHGRVAEATERDPRLVFGVLERSEAVEVLDDWDTHGMRATQSRTTRLHGAEFPAERLLATTPVGPNPDPFVRGIFGAFELLIASVYLGIAERAITVGSRVAATRRSATKGIVHADDPDIRWRLADAAIAVDGALLQCEKVVADLDALGTGEEGPGVTDHGARWFLHFSGVKARATEAAIGAVDQVLRASGGAQFFRRSELERLSRDVRAAMYHPSDEESVHASYAKALLGEIGETRTELPR